MAVPRPIRRFPRRFGLLAALSALIALVLGIVPAAASETAASETAASETAAPAALSVADRGTAGTKPTIVLVHGAFADASGWNDVTENLQEKGYPVYAFANPLRSVSGDAEYLRLFLSTIPGPLVVVGHSYGGFVVTNGATGNPNVKALVYIAAYAPDEGETILAANALGGGHSDLGDHIIVRPYPGAPPGDADGYIDPAFFHDLFAQDLPRRQTAVMAASQRPAAVSLFVSPSGPPAWKTIPSWYLVARNDRTIPPEAERAMAARAGAKTVEIRSSHVAMMSHPDKVTELILAAARR
jgi:pimeloyl-ACP methyl ester carboxylesterase